MLFILLCLGVIVTPAPAPLSLPTHFEPAAVSSARFTAVGFPGAVTFEPAGVTVAAPTGESFRLSFPGARPATIEPIDPLPGTSSYFFGNQPSAWRSAVPHYARLLYRNLYPHIDAVFYTRNGELEFDFLVHPGADPRQIRIAIPNASLSPSGTIDIRAGTRTWTLRKPLSYQGSQPVESSFLPTPQGHFAFHLGPYNPHAELVIDPSIVFSTYFGGAVYSSAAAVAVDPAGYIYVTGQTGPTPFPGTPIGTRSGMFITKLTPSGDAVVYSIYCGSTGVTVPNGIAVDAAGHAYVTGSTNGVNFPAVNALQPTLAGFDDAFLVKLNPAGTGFVYSTYLGGSGSDQALGIAVDSAGNAAITGVSQSANFPLLAPALSAPASAGISNVFTSRINAAGSALLYSTFLGVGRGTAIALDTAGNSYIAGNASGADLPAIPATPGAYSTTLHQFGDLFLTKLNPAGSARVFSTYVGLQGSAGFARGIAVDAAGNAFIAGEVKENNGIDNAFLAKFNPAGTARLNWKTLIYAKGNGVALAPDGSVFVAGVGFYAFPTIDSLQPYRGGDAFLASLDPTGTTWRFATLLGGSTSDEAFGVASDPDGNAILVGSASSPDFPTVAPIQPTFYPGAWSQAFIAKIASCSFTLTPPTANFPIAGGAGSVQVAALPSCTWTTRSSAPWLKLAPPASGAGNATVNYTVDPYPGYDSRTATISIGGASLRVTQAGLPCSYTLSAPAASVSASASTVSVNILAGAECPWSASSPRAWAALTSPATGFGNATVTIAVAANPGTERSATLTIAGQPFTLSQSSASTSPQPVFEEPLTFPGGLPNQSTFNRLRSADMNGDGKADIVASSGDISVFLGNASGTLTRSGAYPVIWSGNFTFLVTQFFIADLNGDAKLDVVAGAYRQNDYRLIFYPGNGDGTLGTPQLTALAKPAFLANIADLNNDNKLDVIFATGSEYIAYLGAGNGTFSGTRTINVTPQQASENTLPSDLNRDGIVDLAYCQHNLTVFRAVSFFGYAVTGREIPLAYSPARCFFHDVNLDTKPDLLAVSSAGIYTHFGNGDATFTQGPASPVSNTAYGYPTAFDLGDLDNDGLADMALIHQVTGGSALATVLGDQFGRFHSPRFLPTPFHDDLVIADINGDGRRDIVANSGASLVVYRNATVSRAVLPPAVTGSTPIRGELASSKIDVTVTNPRGWQDIDVVNVLINSAIDGRRACYLAYSVAANALYLVDDAGNAAGPFAGGLVPGTSATIANPQCSIKGATTTATGSRDFLTLSLDVTFNSAWSGNRVVYAAVRDKSGRNSGWRPTATWNVPAPAAPLVTVKTMNVPIESLSEYRTLEIRFSHRTDSSNLGILNVLINDAIDGRNACYFAHNVATGDTILVNDAGDAGGPFAGTLPRNSSNDILNSQCRLVGNSSGWSGGLPSGTNDYVLTLNLIFHAPFRGPRLVFAAARDKNDQNNTGWQSVGLLNLYQP